MAVVRYKCTACNREIEIIEQPAGLEHIGPCNITNKCRGNLYKTARLQDYAVGQFPPDVRGLTNYVQRNVVYDHTQAIADTVWLVEHNLGVNPSVQVIVDREEVVNGVVTVSRVEIQPDLITIIDKNTLTLTFDRPESGLAQVIARSSRSDAEIPTVEAATTYLPITVDGILTIAVNINSLQFPEGTTSGTCDVRIYYLEDESLDETAFDTAVFQNYDARSPVSTSAWNSDSEIFVNGETYTVLTIDIGDPITDLGAPSAGTIAFQSGTATSGFAYDQAPNMVILLSNEPHQNVDKVRNNLFRPDWDLGPTQSLDSFIFANGEFFVDQSVTERVFPPIYSVTAPQTHPVESTPPTVEGAFVLAFASFGSEGDAFGVVYTSDNDIDTWTGVNPNTNFSFPNFAGAVYAPTLGTSGRWVIVARKGSSANSIWYSDDDGVTWTMVTPPGTPASNEATTRIAWSPTLGVFVVGCNTGVVVRSTDGINWSVCANTPSSSGVFGFGQILTTHWSEDLGLFFCGTTNNDFGFSADGDTWTLATEPPPTSSDDIKCIYSVGTRVFAANNNDETVYYSDNSGSSWTLATTDIKPTFNAPANLAANSDGSVLMWMGPGSNSGNFVWRSTDNGVSFTRVDVATQLGITNLRSYGGIFDPDYGFILGGYDNDAFVEPYPDNGRGRNFIATSDDGLTWTTRLQDQFEHTTTGSPALVFDRNEIAVFASKNQV